MPWYNIIIYLLDGTKRTGARNIDHLDRDLVRKELYKLASYKLKRYKIRNIEFEEVPDDHPAVWAAIKKNKGETD